MAGRFYHLEPLHPEHERLLRELCAGQETLARKIDALAVTITKEEHIVRAEIQSLVTAIGPLVDSSKRLEQIVADEKTAIDALTAAAANNQGLSPEDTAALADILTKITGTSDEMTAAANAVAPAATAATTAAAAPTP